MEDKKPFDKEKFSESQEMATNDKKPFDKERFEEAMGKSDLNKIVRSILGQMKEYPKEQILWAVAQIYKSGLVKANWHREARKIATNAVNGGAFTTGSKAEEMRKMDSLSTEILRSTKFDVFDFATVLNMILRSNGYAVQAEKAEALLANE